LSSQLLAEFFGTFALAFAIGCNLSQGAAGGSSGASTGSSGAVGAPGASIGGGLGPTSIGLTLAASVYALAEVSGAHFNPAVTLAVVLLRRLSVRTGVLYVCVQVAAAALASDLSLRLCRPPDGAFELHPGDALSRACFAEFLYTGLLCFVVISVAATAAKMPIQFYGFAIGLSIMAGGYAAGSISGAILNPAATLGIAITSSKNFGAMTAYCSAQLAGAVFATLLHYLMRPEDRCADRLNSPVPPALVSKLASEFVGTFYLALTLGLAIILKVEHGACAVAAALTCMTFVLADISGGHLNPAVTFAVFVSRGCVSCRIPLLYAAVQFLAGIAGSSTALAICSGKGVLSVPVQEDRWNMWGCIQVGVAELYFTMLLCFVWLSVANVADKKLSDFAALAVGSCVTMAGFAVGHISGGVLNPAVSFGLALMGMCGQVAHAAPLLILFVLCEFAGALLAAAFFFGTRLKIRGTSDHFLNAEQCKH